MIAECVQPGWTNEVYLENVGGHPGRVLFYADGSTRFQHRCDRGERGIIMCAPLLLGVNHRIVQDSPKMIEVTVEGITVEQRNVAGLTIEPSILCPDCGTHGHVLAGRWVPA